MLDATSLYSKTHFYRYKNGKNLLKDFFACLKIKKFCRKKLKHENYSTLCPDLQPRQTNYQSAKTKTYWEKYVLNIRTDYNCHIQMLKSYYSCRIKTKGLFI